MLLVSGGEPRALVVIGPDAGGIERHAAEEFARYVCLMSNARPQIVNDANSEQAVVVIGGPSTNPLAAEAEEHGLVDFSYDALGEDGFVVATVSLHGRNALILGGRHRRSTLYAVYTFLEDTLGVGFFRDGERIPHSPTIETGALNVRERPRFSGRLDGNGCMFHYSALPWSREDWRREMDWKVKRRANMVTPFCIGLDIVPSILRDWGVTPGPPTELPYARHHEWLHQDAHRLGLVVPCTIPDMQVPPSFLEAFPSCRTVCSDWSGYAPTRRLHPEDPMFRRFVLEFIRRYVDRYGTDHVYYANFLAEDRLIEGADNRHALWLHYARAMSAALREADPKATWLVDTWCFDMDASEPDRRWSSEQVSEYLDEISVPFVVCDLWAEEAGKYGRTNWFDGNPWGFGVLHSFGGSAYLHGDVHRLMERMRSIEQSPNPERCTHFFSMPELSDHNPFYMELVAQLSWDPGRVKLESFTESYCRKRYGDEGQALEPAIRRLIATVYGPLSGSIVNLLDPLYWFRLTPELYVGAPELKDQVLATRRQRESFIPELRAVMIGFLGQPLVLAESRMARRDLVDITRAWIAERFAREMRLAVEAFRDRRKEAFELAAVRSVNLLRRQAKLLASWPEYRLDRKVKGTEYIFGERACWAVKHSHVWTSFDAHLESEDLHDYYRMDLDGLVSGYYLPRVAAFLALLRNKMAAGEATVSDEELEAVYAPIERAFLSEPLKGVESTDDVVSLVRDLLNEDDAQAPSVRPAAVRGMEGYRGYRD